MLIFSFIAIDMAHRAAKLWLDVLAATIRPEAPKRTGVIVYLYSPSYDEVRNVH